MIRKKKGAVKRYVRVELRLNRLFMMLCAIFLLGVFAGCRLADSSSQVMEDVAAYLTGTNSQGFLQGLAAELCTNALVLCIIFLCGFGAIFQPIVLGVILLKGVGFGVLGVIFCSARTELAYYLLVLLPKTLLNLILIALASCVSLRFSQRFFLQLFPQEMTENLTPPDNGTGAYLLRFLLFYLIGGGLSVVFSVAGTFVL